MPLLVEESAPRRVAVPRRGGPHPREEPVHALVLLHAREQAPRRQDVQGLFAAAARVEINQTQSRAWGA